MGWLTKNVWLVASVLTLGMIVLAGQAVAGGINPPVNTTSTGVVQIAGDLGSPVNGNLWYNTVTNKFRCHENSSSVDCIGGGGGTITGSGTNNTMTKWTGATSIGDSAATDDGTNLLYGGATIGLLENGASPTLYGSLDVADLTGARTYTLPDATGEVSLLGQSIDVASEITGVTPVANGGTGSASQNFVDLTTNQSVAGDKTFTGATTVIGDGPTTDRLGINQSSPLTTVDVDGNVRTQAPATIVLTGSIDPTASAAVVGVGTLFTTELVIGDEIVVSGETREVKAITDNLNLTVTKPFSDNANDTSPDRLPAFMTITDSAGALTYRLNKTSWLAQGDQTGGFACEGRSASPTGLGGAITSSGARGTLASPTAITGVAGLSGDDYGIFIGRGYDGDSFEIGGRITFSAEETWSNSQRGTRIIFENTPTGSTASREVGSFNPAGGFATHVAGATSTFNGPVDQPSLINSATSGSCSGITGSLGLVCVTDGFVVLNDSIFNGNLIPRNHIINDQTLDCDGQSSGAVCLFDTDGTRFARGPVYVGDTNAGAQDFNLTGSLGLKFTDLACPAASCPTSNPTTTRIRIDCTFGATCTYVPGTTNALDGDVLSVHVDKDSVDQVDIAASATVKLVGGTTFNGQARDNIRFVFDEDAWVEEHRANVTP